MQINNDLLQNAPPKNSSIDQIFAEAVETTDNEKEDQELLQKESAVTPSTMNKRDTRDRTHRNDATKSNTYSKNFTPMLIETQSQTPMDEEEVEEEVEEQSANEVTEPKDTTTLKQAQ